MNVYIQRQPRQPAPIVLDLDATDDRLHGNQEGCFYHGYYGGYCYLPLYIFIGKHLVCARLRESNQDASAGALEEVERIVKQLRQTWPDVEIMLRADSGFCREELMSWCERQGGAGVQRISLPHAEELEPQTPRRGQGRVVGQGQ